MISGVTEWGLYVELSESKCEGLVAVRNLGDDFYEYDEVNYCLRGKTIKENLCLGRFTQCKGCFSQSRAQAT